MKSEKNILIAFILNLSFSIFEFFGGIFTGSIAIVSDAVHDIGDATSIGVSFFLERKSKKRPNEKYTYGYLRYSVLGSTITTLILILGSIMVICTAITRIVAPMPINYDGMIIFALVGVCINFTAALLTCKSKSLNQKAVNLHMLEDVLGWIAVLLAALIMRFTNFYLIDPLISIGVAIFILINAVKMLKKVLNIFLEKAPHGINTNDITAHIVEIEGVLDVHHIHIWSMDGYNNYATMHIVTNEDPYTIKSKIREELKKHGIVHSTLEFETANEECYQKNCNTNFDIVPKEHHHHH